MTAQKAFWSSLLAVATASLVAGCSADGHGSAQRKPPPPTVNVATVTSEQLNEWDTFTGRLEAPHRVEIRPRVAGYIQSVAFEDGSLVEAGELLFVIDPRPFQAVVKRLEAELARLQAQRNLARQEYDRASRLGRQEAISAAEVDQRESALRQAEAAVAATRARLLAARLDLEYTRITAPFAGRVSRAEAREGSLVAAGETLLTTLVSTDRVYAYFNIDERTYLDYQRLARNGKRPSSRVHGTPAFLGLAGEGGFPHRGYVDFLDNRVNPGTGTIRARAVFDNSEGRFTPGLFARIKVVGSGKHEMVLVNDRAIGTDLANRFVYVLDDNNQVQYRAVELGPKMGGMRVIRAGLAAGETIVVNGLQRVRPGITVNPRDVAMASPSTLDAIYARQRAADGSTATGSFAAVKPAAAADSDS